MIKTWIVASIFMLCMLVCGSGCEPTDTSSGSQDNLSEPDSVRAGYCPVKVDIIPLTELIHVDDNDQPQVHIFVSLLDSFGSRIKSPAIFRFELYEHTKLSGRPKGKRLMLWPQFDLNDAENNNEYWRDFLRAYEFKLDLETKPDRTFILQVTCMSLDGKRLFDEFEIKHTR